MLKYDSTIISIMIGLLLISCDHRAYAITSMLPISDDKTVVNSTNRLTTMGTAAISPITILQVSDDTKARPEAMMSTAYVPRTTTTPEMKHTTVANSRYPVTITRTMTITTNNVPSATRPTPFKSSHSSSANDTNSNAKYMSNIAANVEDLVSALTFNITKALHGTTNLSSCTPEGLALNQSTTTPKVLTGANMALIDLPNSSLIFLNTTAPNYVFVDSANGGIVVWSVASGDQSTHSATAWKRFATQAMAWLPFLEVLGAGACLFKIVKFLCHWIKKDRRGEEDHREEGSGIQEDVASVRERVDGRSFGEGRGGASV
jgi:hypothetical protein